MMQSPLARRLTLAVAILSAALFVIIICAPTTASLLHFTPNVELTEAPPLALPDPAASFNDFSQFLKILRRNWLDQAFGLRPLFLRWEKILDIPWLKSSTPRDPVLLGKDGWFYLAQETPDLNVIDNYRAVSLLTPAELKTWAAVFAARRDWLAQRGIRYMVVVAPDKTRVYPEFIPARFNRIREQSKLDQMIEALAAVQVDVVDLRPAVFAAKKQGQGYYRTDSHWTPLGAFFAYVDVVNRLKKYFPGLEPMRLEDFTTAAEPGSPHAPIHGDLPRMLALGDFYSEDAMLFTPKIPFKAKAVAGEDKLDSIDSQTVFEGPDPTLPRAVIFRDSFVRALIPFLNEHFSRVVFIWPWPTSKQSVRKFDTEAILKEKPDIVIDQFAERYFTMPPPDGALDTLPQP